jgi:hypothetical protein
MSGYDVAERIRRSKSTCTLHLVAAFAALLLSLSVISTRAAEPQKSAPVKLAVFDFELQDITPAASYMNKTTSSAANLEKASSEARRVLADSGRYSLIDTSKSDVKAVTDQSLRNCDGCEADIALHLGAEQSLIGVVTRVTQTDYYVQIQIRDCKTGKILNQQEANFAGGDDGWASGVRMLIKHQILAQG